MVVPQVVGAGVAVVRVVGGCAIVAQIDILAIVVVEGILSDSVASRAAARNGHAIPAIVGDGVGLRSGIVRPSADVDARTSVAQICIVVVGSGVVFGMRFSRADALTGATQWGSLPPVVFPATRLSRGLLSK